MTITKTLLAGFAATALLSGAASAADDQKPFDGVYAGAEVGVDWTKLAGQKYDSSLYYGGVLGMRRQADNDMVIGLEGTFGDTGYKTGAAGMNTDYEWGISGILGQAYGDNLFYGKVGYVETKFDATENAAGGTFRNGGWRFGAGYERALSNGLSLRLGGDYTTYGEGVKSWQTKAGLIARF